MFNTSDGCRLVWHDVELGHLTSFGAPRGYDGQNSRCERCLLLLAGMWGRRGWRSSCGSVCGRAAGKLILVHYLPVSIVWFCSGEREQRSICRRNVVVGLCLWSWDFGSRRRRQVVFFCVRRIWWFDGWCLRAGLLVFWGCECSRFSGSGRQSRRRVSEMWATRWSGVCSRFVWRRGWVCGRTGWRARKRSWWICTGEILSGTRCASLSVSVASCRSGVPDSGCRGRRCEFPVASFRNVGGGGERVGRVCTLRCCPAACVCDYWRRVRSWRACCALCPTLRGRINSDFSFIRGLKRRSLTGNIWCRRREWVSSTRVWMKRRGLRGADISVRMSPAGALWGWRRCGFSVSAYRVRGGGGGQIGVKSACASLAPPGVFLSRWPTGSSTTWAEDGAALPGSPGLRLRGRRSERRDAGGGRHRYVRCLSDCVFVCGMFRCHLCLEELVARVCFCVRGMRCVKQWVCTMLKIGVCPPISEVSRSRCIRSIVRLFLRKRESSPIGSPSHSESLQGWGGVRQPPVLRGGTRLRLRPRAPLLQTFEVATLALFGSSHHLLINRGCACKAGSCLSAAYKVSVWAWAGVALRGIPLIFLDWMTRNKHKNREGQGEERRSGNHNNMTSPSHATACVIRTFRRTDFQLVPNNTFPQSHSMQPK